MASKVFLSAWVSLSAFSLQEINIHCSNKSSLISPGVEAKLDSRQRLPPSTNILLVDVHLLEALYGGALTTRQLGLSARQLVRKMIHSWLWRSVGVGHEDGVISVRGLQVVRGTGHLSLALSKQPG